MKKKIIILLSTVPGTTALTACPFCNPQIKQGIYNSAFYPNLGTMMLGFIALAIIVAILSAISLKRHRSLISANPSATILSPVPLTTASLVMGIGIGGFIDGIVLHQILQVHEMLSYKIPSTDYIGKSINMFWDGIFHFFCLLIVLVGIILFWKLLQRKDAERSGRLLAGGLIAGWGLFNIVEGVIDHHILKLHNVIELMPDHSIANYGFLAISVVLLIIGFLLIRSRKPATGLGIS